MKTDDKIAILEGTITLQEEENDRLRAQLDWFALSQDQWRTRYLLEHPEADNWESVSDMEP
jgi:hypothetical protein